MTGKCINKNHLILGSSDHRWTWLHWSRWVIKTSKIWGYQWYCSFTLLKFDNCLILFCCEKVTLLVLFNSIKASNKIRIEPPLMCCLFMLSWFSYSTLRVWFICFVLFCFVFFFFHIYIYRDGAVHGLGGAVAPTRFKKKNHNSIYILNFFNI